MKTTKIFAFAIALIMVLALAACGDNAAPEDAPEPEPPAPQVSEPQQSAQSTQPANDIDSGLIEFGYSNLAVDYSGYSMSFSITGDVSQAAKISWPNPDLKWEKAIIAQLKEHILPIHIQTGAYIELGTGAAISFPLDRWPEFEGQVALYLCFLLDAGDTPIGYVIVPIDMTGMGQDGGGAAEISYTQQGDVIMFTHTTEIPVNEIFGVVVLGITEDMIGEDTYLLVYEADVGGADNYHEKIPVQGEGVVNINAPPTQGNYRVELFVSSKRIDHVDFAALPPPPPPPPEPTPSSPADSSAAAGPSNNTYDISNAMNRLSHSNLRLTKINQNYFQNTFKVEGIPDDAYIIRSGGRSTAYPEASIRQGAEIILTAMGLNLFYQSNGQFALEHALFHPADVTDKPDAHGNPQDIYYFLYFVSDINNVLLGHVVVGIPIKDITK